MRFLRCIAVLWLPAAVLCAPPAVGAVDPFHRIAELNYYEWTAVAPIVVSGESLGEIGRFVEYRVDHVLRGGTEIEVGAQVLIDLKSANKNRRRSDYPDALKLTFGADFILLLEPARETKDRLNVYPLARGVLSARELPVESQQGILDAVAMFIEIQDRKSVV